MGKNYSKEIALLPGTVQWTSTLNIDTWKEAFQKLRDRTLLVVASGGSVSAAQLLAQLHTAATGQVAVAMTPLEFMSSNVGCETTVCFISAGGNNHDILSAWQASNEFGSRHRVVLCGSASSRLAQLATAVTPRTTLCFDLPAGRDGFLATNSLVAFFTLILRLYDIPLPALGTDSAFQITDELIGRQTLIVLYSGYMKPVAVDLESRFTEAALGTVQLSDFRNFAHGRHHWLAKRGKDAAVLALSAPESEELAQATLAQLPDEVLVVQWHMGDDSPAHALLALRSSIELAGRAASLLGYNAGRPGVPPFGEAIYNLTLGLNRQQRLDRKSASVRRKLRTLGHQGFSAIDTYAEAFDRFERQLDGITFAGVVFDYDGTIISAQERDAPITVPMAEQLNRLLDEGLVIGLATGRGKSAQESLRKSIEERFWSRVLIGFYNGGALRMLSDSCEDIVLGPVADCIVEAERILRAVPELKAADVQLRPKQLTVCANGMGEHGLWMSVISALGAADLRDVKVTHSSHSVDVLPVESSKCTVASELAALCGNQVAALLRIGDRGRYPGNDSELLDSPFGLSVDEVSSSAAHCWNLLPQGVAGHHGTLFYLRHLRNGRLLPLGNDVQL